MGNSVAQEFMITPNTRRSDMSQAGSRGGCLQSGQRNLDANHTPPYTNGQPLKWTVRDDRCMRRGNTKKRAGFRWNPPNWLKLFRYKLFCVSPWQRLVTLWYYFNELPYHETFAGKGKSPTETVCWSIQPEQENYLGQSFICSSVLFCLLVFSLLEVPACYVWPTSKSLWQLYTHACTHTCMHTHIHSLAFTGGHTRKVSIPGFFQ